jgi:hypothetical protein
MTTPHIIIDPRTGNLVPEANNLIKVGAVVDAIKSGQTTSADIGAFFGSVAVGGRGGHYYACAAEFFELVTRENGSTWQLTDTGTIFAELGAADRLIYLTDFFRDSPYWEETNDGLQDLGFSGGTSTRLAAGFASWRRQLENLSDLLEKAPIGSRWHAEVFEGLLKEKTAAAAEETRLAEAARRQSETEETQKRYLAWQSANPERQAAQERRRLERARDTAHTALTTAARRA